MLQTLRNRLILSHILPLVIIIPLMGATMLYVIETLVLLPIIYNDLAKDAQLLAEITHNQPGFWSDASAARVLVEGLSPYLGGRVSMVSLSGTLLASSEPGDVGLGGQIVEIPNLEALAQGDIIQLQRGPFAEVFAPVFSENGQPIGIIRITSRVLTVSEEVYQLRYLLGTVLLFGVVAGVAVGSYLAVSINRPIQQITRSIHALAIGDWNYRLDEHGPSEIRMLAQAVNSLVDRLHSLEDARRQLLANLVHELGRPLGALRSAIQALLKGANSDPHLSHDLLRGMDDETNRLKHLLDDLSSLHGQVLGTLELQRETLNFSEWLPLILGPWRTAAQEKGVIWNDDIPSNLPDLSVDPDRLAQAIGNLLSNAIKFTPSGGDIVTTAGVNKDRLWIRVKDTGPGIPSEEREKIFQPFYRAAHGRRIVQGMGLGLTIAKDIVNALGGVIEVEGAPGRGSQFTVWLPLRSMPGGHGETSDSTHDSPKPLK